jgi:hypothetical protein
MKTLKHLALCLVAAFIATGCNQENNEPQKTPKKGTPAEFTMTINGGSNTRTITTNDSEKRTISWRTGDEVGIFAVGTDGTQNNCKYTYDGTEWKATNVSDAITLENGETYSFYAYYPYTEKITVATNASLNVLPDQSVAQGDGNSNYDLSDILISKVEASEYNGTSIELQYSHAYAMVEVLIAGDKVGDTAPEKVLLKNVITDASINLVTQEIMPTTNKQDIVMAYVANEENNGTYLYRAIVPEQTIEKGSVLLEVYGVNSGKNYMFRAPQNEAVKYPQGKYFRMEVTIGKYNAGIKFPAGSINPWTPSDGIDLEGEELIENLIKIPVANLTTETFQQITSTNYNQEYNFWYGLTHKDDAAFNPSISFNQEGYISYKLLPNVATSWYKSGVGYHHSEKFEPGYYKLSFKKRFTELAPEKNSIELYVFLRITPTNSDKDWFVLTSKADKSSQRTQIKSTAVENEWPEEPTTIFFDFTKASNSAYNANSPITIEGDYPYNSFDLKFVYLNESAGTVLIKDVKLEKVDKSEIPTDLLPTAP